MNINTEEKKICPICMGTGKRIIINRIGLVMIPITQRCSECNGKGYIEQK